MKTMKFAALLTALLAGCAGTKSNLSESRNGPLASLQVSTMEGGSPQPVAPGQTLQSGNQFLVSVGVERPSYVYLALASGGRPPALIVPDKGESPPRIEPGVVRQFPAPGKYFTLDDQLGEESIVAVFATQPLSEAQLTEFLSGGERTATARSESSDEKTRDVPPIATTATRGIVREKSAANRDTAGVKVTTPLLEQRPSVLKFAFIHGG